MIISISGVPGSGKTSVGKLLAASLGYPFYSVGGLRGKMALERGITLDALNAIGEQDASTDSLVDDYQRTLGTTEDNFVIEGRLSWHFIPHSYKIFLDCDPREAARRIYEARKHTNENRSDEPEYATIEDAMYAIKTRTKSDVRRYSKYYGVSHLDHAQYDFVLDTTAMTGPEVSAKVILDEIRKIT